MVNHKPSRLHSTSIRLDSGFSHDAVIIEVTADPVAGYPAFASA
jgi:hypothetical protein